MEKRTRKLSDSFLRGLKPPATGRREFSDTKSTGLEFRLTSSGAASWSFRYREPITRRLTRITLGAYPEIKLAKARRQADDYRAAVAGGKDPAAEKRKARDEAATKTFGALADRYMIEHAKRHKRSWRQDDRNLRLHVLPRWRSRAYVSITRGDVIELLEGIVSAGRLTLVNRVQSLISKVFAFAIDAGLMTTSPAFRLRRRGKERKRKRVLSDGEIKLFWSRAIEAPLSYRSGQALRLALLTGVRVSEAAGAARDELEHVEAAAQSVWIIPGERTKSGLPHAIPLGPMARALVLEMLGSNVAREFLFPGRRPGTAIRGQSLSNAMLRFGDELADEIEAATTWRAEPATAHDLRRTFATRMAALGVPKEIRDRLLNHAPDRGDIEGSHYNVHDYLPEKRRALAQWDAALSAILNGRSGAVVQLGAARKRAGK
jgi:integrase